MHLRMFMRCLQEKTQVKLGTPTHPQVKIEVTSTMKIFKFGTVLATYWFLLQTMCFTAFAERALDMLNTLIKTKLPGVSQTHEDPVSILLYAEKVCEKLKDEPQFNFLNRKIVAAKSACDRINFSILDEVSEDDTGFIDLQMKKGGRRRKGIVKGVKKVGKFVKKHAGKILTVVSAASIVFPPAAGAAAAAKAGSAAKAGANAAKAGADAAKAGAKAGEGAAKSGAKAGEAAAKSGKDSSNILKKVGDKFKHYKEKINKITEGIKKGFGDTKLGEMYNKLPKQVRSVIQQEAKDTIMAKTVKIREKYDGVVSKLMAAKDSFAGKLAYSMMAGDDLLQFVAKEAKGHLKERVDTVVELYTDQAMRYVQGDVALWGIEEVSMLVKKYAHKTIDGKKGTTLFVETSSFAYLEAGEHIVQSYKRLSDPVHKVQLLDALCKELETKQTIDKSLLFDCQQLDFTSFDDINFARVHLSFLEMQTHLQKKKKKSFGKKIAKAFATSALGNFQSSFSKIGGGLGKLVAKASDFLNSNDNVIGRLLNKVRELKNVAFKKVFSALNKYDSFVNKFISKFPAPIRMKLRDAMTSPIDKIREKITLADAKLDAWLNPVELQYEKLKDKYVPQYARELMALDGVPAESLPESNLEEASQEYIDQAKGKIESNLGDGATEHVNANIKKLDQELDDAEKRLDKKADGSSTAEAKAGKDSSRNLKKEAKGGKDTPSKKKKVGTSNTDADAAATTEVGVGDSCRSNDGSKGICKINSGNTIRDCGANGEFVRNKCRGPRNVQCCIINEPTSSSQDNGNNAADTATTTEVGVGDSCRSNDGSKGICKINSGNTIRDCGANGEFVRNKCRGPRNVQCCIINEPTSSSQDNGNNAADTATTTEVGVGDSCRSNDGSKGICKINSGNTIRDCGANGEFVRNKCRGPRNVQCCVQREVVVYSDGERGKFQKMLDEAVKAALRRECKKILRTVADDNETPLSGLLIFKDCVASAKNLVGLLYQDANNLFLKLCVNKRSSVCLPLTSFTEAVDKVSGGYKTLIKVLEKKVGLQKVKDFGEMLVRKMPNKFTETIAKAKKFRSGKGKFKILVRSTKKVGTRVVGGIRAEVLTGFIQMLGGVTPGYTAKSGAAMIRDKLRSFDNTILELFSCGVAYLLCQAAITASTGGVGAVTGFVVCNAIGAAVSEAVAIGYAHSSTDRYFNKLIDAALDTRGGQWVLKYFERQHQTSEMQRWLPYTHCKGGRKKTCTVWDTKQQYLDHVRSLDYEANVQAQKELRGEKDCSKERKKQRVSEQMMKTKCEQRNKEKKEEYEKSLAQKHNVLANGYYKEDCSKIENKKSYQYHRCNRGNNDRRLDALKNGFDMEDCEKEWGKYHHYKQNCELRNRERAEKDSIAAHGYIKLDCSKYYHTFTPGLAGLIGDTKEAQVQKCEDYNKNMKSRYENDLEHEKQITQNNDVIAKEVQQELSQIETTLKSCEGYMYLAAVRKKLCESENEKIRKRIADMNLAAENQKQYWEEKAKDANDDSIGSFLELRASVKSTRNQMSSLLNKKNVEKMRVIMKHKKSAMAMEAPKEIEVVDGDDDEKCDACVTSKINCVQDKFNSKAIAQSCSSTCSSKDNDDFNSFVAFNIRQECMLPKLQHMKAQQRRAMLEVANIRYLIQSTRKYSTDSPNKNMETKVKELKDCKKSLETFLSRKGISVNKK
eukprot:g8203.t1